jgi:hypothetical protein
MKPILFSTGMVRAILDGRKTQTRRVVHKDIDPGNYDSPDYVLYRAPYGQSGARLWVREAFWCDNQEYIQTYKNEPWRGTPDPQWAEIHYRASERDPDIFPKWRPSIHMPRWAARIFLEITAVRVERLQDISRQDAKAEGIIEEEFYPDEGYPLSLGYTCEFEKVRLDEPRGLWNTPQKAFKELWDSIAKPGERWEDNPWVWVYEFRRLTTKEDEGE